MSPRLGVGEMASIAELPRFDPSDLVVCNLLARLAAGWVVDILEFCSGGGSGVGLHFAILAS